MALQFGNTKIGEMQYNGVTIGEAMIDGQIVYRSLPVVTITSTNELGFESRSQFRQACIDHGTTYQTVETLPFLLDTSQSTILRFMFDGCSSLTQVPDLDTSQATNLSYMFRDCSSLTDGNVRCIGRHPDAYTNGMIARSGLTRLPFYDTNGNPI